MKQILLSFLFFISFNCYTQTFRAVANGDWSDITIWDDDNDGIGGDGIPGSGDVVLTNGFSVGVDSDVTVRTLSIDANTANSIVYSDPTSTFEDTWTITIENLLTTTNSGGPTAAVVENTDLLLFDLTGTSIVLRNWDNSAPINSITFSGVGSPTVATNIVLGGGDMIVSSSTTLTIPVTRSIENTVPSFIRIQGSLNLEGAINGDGTSSTNFGSLRCLATGTVDIGVDGYLNTNSIILDGGSILNVGNDQNNGWWHDDSPGPFSTNLGSTSVVNYNRENTQGIAARRYGSLSITSNGSVATKNLSSSGTLEVRGDLEVGGSTTFSTANNSNNISFRGNITNEGILNITRPVIFLGGVTHLIDGPEPVTFGGILTISANNDLDVNTDITFGGNIIDNNNDLNFGADFTFNGTTYNQGDGILTFDAGGPQQIAGSGDINFRSITFLNSTISINATNGSISESLSATGGNIDFDGSGSGSFTLVSNASGSASVGNLSTTTISGNVNFERFFDGAGEYWRNWGTPVAGSVTDIPYIITGNEFARYDESVPGTVDDGWELQTDFGNSIANNRGYSQYVRSEEGNLTLSITGPLSDGNVILQTSYTDHGSLPDDGWNLVNNPYASTIDWGSGGWTKTNLDAAAYVWNGNQYITLSGSSGDLISSGQAFWVKADGNGATSLVASQSVKDNMSTPFLRTDSENENWLKITLMDGELRDVAHVRFRNEATEEFDSQFDGYKLQNSIFNFSSLTNEGMELSLNTIPMTSCSRTLMLNMTNIEPGTYQMIFDDLQTLSLGYSLTLTDDFTNESVAITQEDQAITFNVTEDAASYGNERFSVSFDATVISDEISYNPEFNDSCGESVSISVQNSQIGLNYELVNADNEPLNNPVLGTGADLEFIIQKEALLVGKNILNLKVSGNSECTDDLLITDFIVFSLRDKPLRPEVSNVELCNSNSTTLYANGAGQNEYYRWYDSFSSTEPITEDFIGELKVSEIEENTTYFVSLVTADGCEGEKAFINVEIDSLNAPEIQITGTKMTVPNSYENYQWSVDGESINGENSNSIVVNQSGVYTVEVTNGSCSTTSIGRELIVTSIDDELFKAGINIYPNPVQNVLNITSNSAFNASDILSMNLFSENGQNVYANKIQTLDRKNLYIDVSDLPNGLFILNIQTKTGNIAVKILKE